MTEAFRLCDHHLARWAALDPVAAGMVGLSGAFGAADRRRAGRIRRTPGADRHHAGRARGGAGGPPRPTSGADRLPAGKRPQRPAGLAPDRGAGSRPLRTPIGQLSTIRDSVHPPPRDGEESWLEHRGPAWPRSRQRSPSRRSSLDAGLDRGLTAARRQAVEAAAAADRCIPGRTTRWWPPTATARWPAGSPRLRSRRTVATGSWPATRARTDAPRASDTGCGRRRAVRRGRQDQPGPADIDPAEADERGLAPKPARDRGRDGDRGGTRSARARARTRPPRRLDQTEYVTGADARPGPRPQDRQDEAVERLDGVLFDIAPPLRRIEAVLARNSSSGAADDTKPSEDPDQARPDLVAARRAGRGGQVPNLVRALHRLPRGGARPSPPGGRGHDGGGRAGPVRQARVRERAR